MKKKEIIKLFDEVLAELQDARKSIVAEIGNGSAKQEANKAVAEDVEKYKERLLELIK